MVNVTCFELLKAASYLVPNQLYIEGGYKVRTTPFSPEAAEVVVRESLRLLHVL